MRLALLIALAACAARPQAVEPAVAPAPYCFRLNLLGDGRTEAGEACGSTRDVCESVQRRAVRWGGMAGIKRVGACGRKGE
jgi:hypothetical protein